MGFWHGTLLGAAAIALIATDASAQGVRWNDDGTVDLMLGPDYDDAVISTTREDLGTLCGPEEQPFEGAEISVTVNASGPKGASPARSMPSGQSGRSSPAAVSTSSSCRSASTTLR